MKVTSPKDMEAPPTLDRAISLFEKALNKELKGFPYYDLSIKFSFSEKVCREVERLYLEAGWGHVECESFERSDSSYLKLWLNKQERNFA